MKRSVFTRTIGVLFLFSMFFLFYNTRAHWIELKGEQLVVKKRVDKQLDLVNIKKVNQNIIVDVRYATNNNLTGEPLYSSGICYVRKHVARVLDAIQKELETMGLGLKIFDGYRPLAVQRYCHERFPKWFAKPNAQRAKHPRGTAVDLTLVDKNGKELHMPTEFDSLSPQAAHEYRKKDMPMVAIENREVLKAIMAKHGFVALAHEWWHYDYYNWKSYAAMEFDFDEVEKMLKEQTKTH